MASQSSSGSKRTILIIIVVLLILALLGWFFSCSEKKTPAPAPVAATPAPAPAPATPVASIDGVATTLYFDFDKADIKSEFDAAVDAHAKYLLADATRKVVIEGNADERGSRSYNLALGQRRADALAKQFEQKGVPAAQISTVSNGEEKPAVKGHNEAAWAKNRRDEIIYR